MKLLQILLFTFALSGCIVTPINSAYKPENINLSKKTNLTVAVLPFVNNVQDQNSSQNGTCVLKQLVPGWLYCTNYHRNDGGRRDFIKFMETMRNALVKDLQANNLFSNVVIGEDKEADIYISANINEYSLTKKSTNYGISVLGYIIGVFGVPKGWALSNTDITYTVTNKNGKELMSKNYTEQASRVYGYYYPSIISMGATLKPINNNFLQDLVEVLK